MKKLFFFLFTIYTSFVFSQTEWYASPSGTPSGNGTITNPWDLQTALNNTAQILPGDILWLRGGVYRGQFDSFLQGTETNPITVQSYIGEKAILNGNTVFPTPLQTPNPPLVNTVSDIQKKIKKYYWALEPEEQAKFYKNAVEDPKLEQNGLRLINLPKPAILIAHRGYVYYKNFEITCLNFFEREFNTQNFFLLDGIRLHSDLSIGNKFIELIIYNNPGIGISSWKDSGKQEFNSCLIYNNGYTNNTTTRGHGSGVYLQNQTNNIKLFKNNVVFNNYYIGFEIWSASTSTDVNDSDYVKNVDLNDNIVFKAGGGYSGSIFETNVLIATNWGSGQTTNPNIARNINVINNIMYHNTDYIGTSGFGTSLVLGWTATAPIKDINIYGNFISGINDAIRFNYAEKTLNYNNNTYWGRYVYHQPNNATNCDISNWSFNNNLYYTNSANAFRQYSIPLDRTISQWQTDFSIDSSSSRLHVGNFIEKTKVEPFNYSNNKYLVTLVRKNGSNVDLDLTTLVSNFSIPIGTPYRIIDVENYHSESNLPFSSIYTGGTINFNMQSITFEMPQNNTTSVKTPANFGCFIVEFEPCSLLNSTTIDGPTYACDLYNETTIHSANLLFGQVAQWSVTGGVGLIVGANNSSSVEVVWSSLPGSLTLEIINNECSTTKELIIQKGCACDIMDANFFTANVNGNTVSDFQFYNSITNNFSSAVICDFGDGSVTTSQPNTHTYLSSGTYVIDVLFYEKQCSSHFYKTVNITNKTWELGKVNKEIKNKKEKLNNNFMIYPNPASNSITIKGDNLINEEIEIYNMLGQKVIQRSLITNETAVDISNLSNGVYTIYFVNSKSKAKIVKQ